VLASGMLHTLARWPVKGLGGEYLDAAAVDHQGVGGDRRYTVADLQAQRHLTAAETPRLLQWTAAGAPVPAVRDPRGRRWRPDDPALAAALSADLGRPVTVRRHANARQYIPGSVLVTVEASRLALERELGQPVDLRRFRTNLHLELDSEPFAEHAWEGRTLRVGAGTFQLLHPCERCVIASRDPGSGRKWPALMQTLRREHGLLFGMLARPRGSASLALGDRAEII